MSSIQKESNIESVVFGSPLYKMFMFLCNLKGVNATKLRYLLFIWLLKLTSTLLVYGVE